MREKLTRESLVDSLPIALLPVYHCITRNIYTQIEFYSLRCPPEGFGVYLVDFYSSTMSFVNAEREMP